MLPGVTILLENGALGLVPGTDDGVAGLLLQTAVAPSGLALLTARQLFSLTDAEALGITSAYDTTNSCKVHKHIKEFYTEGGKGRTLWIMLVSNAVSMATMADKTQANYAVKLLDAASGSIRLLGITRSAPGAYTPVTAGNGLDVDSLNAALNAQALATEYADNFKPLRVLVEGYAYTGVPAEAKDLKTLTHNRVSVVLGDTATGANAAVGLLLGRLAKVPVQRNPGRVKDGAVATNTAFLGATNVATISTASIQVLHDKGYILFRLYSGRSGFYYNDDPTATIGTDDYSSLARGRVIDKAIRIAYNTFVNEILDEVLIDADGRIATVKAGYYEAIIANQVNTAMTANGEISAFEAFVDPLQNVLSTGKICVDLRIVPVGYAKEIKVTLGFNNPALA